MLASLFPWGVFSISGGKFMVAFVWMDCGVGLMLGSLLMFPGVIFVSTPSSAFCCREVSGFSMLVYVPELMYLEMISRLNLYT